MCPSIGFTAEPSDAVVRVAGDAAGVPDSSGTSLPDWLTLVDNGDGTGTLSGTPQTGDVGDHEIRLDLSLGEKPIQIFQ